MFLTPIVDTWKHLFKFKVDILVFKCCDCLISADFQCINDSSSSMHPGQTCAATYIWCHSEKPSTVSRCTLSVNKANRWGLQLLAFVELNFSTENNQPSLTHIYWTTIENIFITKLLISKHFCLFNYENKEVLQV